MCPPIELSEAWAFGIKRKMLVPDYALRSSLNALLRPFDSWDRFPRVDA